MHFCIDNLIFVLYYARKINSYPYYSFPLVIGMQFSEIMFEQLTPMKKYSLISNIRYEGTATFITTRKYDAQILIVA